MIFKYGSLAICGTFSSPKIEPTAYVAFYVPLEPNGFFLLYYYRHAEEGAVLLSGRQLPDAG